MKHLRSLTVILLLSGGMTFGCSPSSSTTNPGGSGNTGDGNGGQSGGGSGSSTKGGGGGTSGLDALFPFMLNDGTGGASDGTGGTTTAVDGASGDDGNAPPARMCLTALGDAPGGYDWNNCCAFEAATAQDWCNHYMAFCKFNYPETNAALSPGSLPLTNMADCLARYPPLTIKSRACRSNFLCEDMSLGQPTAKSCDFADLNRRKCDGA